MWDDIRNVFNWGLFAPVICPNVPIAANAAAANAAAANGASD